jgi:hypothetical protein
MLSGGTHRDQKRHACIVSEPCKTFFIIHVHLTFTGFVAPLFTKVSIAIAATTWRLACLTAATRLTPQQSKRFTKELDRIARMHCVSVLLSKR